jgi:Transglycosylase SLT domain
VIGVRLHLVIAGAILVLLAACASSGPDGGAQPTGRGAVQETPPLPRPDEPIPRHPGRVAERLTTTTAALYEAIDRWRAAGDPRGPTPDDVTLHALHQQRIHLLLANRSALARGVIPRLGAPLARSLRTTIGARRSLGKLVTPVPVSRFETGPALPAGVLLGYYRKAERRFRVAWHVLAAVNFVETAFGRVRNESVGGARGPMQFIPSTWEAYGMGGDVRDPHDAIMGSANYLRASGAPGDYLRALYAYNPSPAYVSAIRGYAREIRRDPRAYFAYHSWQVFVRTPSGTRRITGPSPLGPRS